jgi:hypothetical protein
MFFKINIIIIIIYLQIFSNGNRDKYYTDTPLNFLINYNKNHSLFNSFYNKTKTNNFQIRNDIELNYKVRDYSYQKEGTSANINKLYHNVSSYYNTNANFIEYNNRFRYGKKPNDRFLGIVFDKDPWIYPNETLIYFYGPDTELENDLYCSFTFPFHGITKALIKDNMLNVVNKISYDQEISCSLPSNINLSNNHKHIKFDLRHNNIKLLSNIKMVRLHELDRRQFNVTMFTMVDDIESKLLYEWLIYHIIIGVEHFFIYDNSKKDKNILNSQLKLFIDANIITLIFYPFSPTNYTPIQIGKKMHWSEVQVSELNLAIKTFGNTSLWMSTSDEDEFFFPSKDFRQNFHPLVDINNERRGLSYIHNILTTLMHHNGGPYFPLPGLMFDTVERGCYNSNLNLNLATIINCNSNGLHIQELKYGHGKMWLRPRFVDFLFSPHRINDYYIGWEDWVSDGGFYHFDNYKYGDIIEFYRKYDDSFSQFVLNGLDKIKLNDTMPIFSFSLLESKSNISYLVEITSFDKHGVTCVNWEDDKDSILFHFNPRKNNNEIVMNTRIGLENWQSEKRIDLPHHLPLNLSIIIDSNGYHIFEGESQLYLYPHVIPYKSFNQITTCKGTKISSKKDFFKE